MNPQIENRKSSWSTTTPPTLDEKRLWTLVNKRKSYWRAYWPTQLDIFRETIFRPSGGAMPLKFLYVLEIDLGYLAHTPTGTGTTKNFNCENIKFGLKFSVCTSITSGLMRISSQIFIQTTYREPGMITWVQFLDGLPPKTWEGKKTVQNFSRFLTTFDFDREYLRNGSTNRKLEK